MTEEDGHQRRPAGAVLAQQRQHLAGTQAQRDIVIGQQRAKAFADVAELQDGSDMAVLEKKDTPLPGVCGQRNSAYFAVDLGWLSSTLTVNLPSWMAFSLARTLATSSAGIFFSKSPAGPATSLCVSSSSTGLVLRR